MFNVELESTRVLDFITSLPSTGAATDADFVPTVAVFEDANDTPILTPTAVKRTSLTGNYRVSIVATTANGFEIDKSYNVVVTATMNGTVGKGVVGRFIMVPAVPYGTIAASGSNTSSTFKTSRTETTNDYWKDALIVFLTGTLAGQVKKVSAYDGTTKFITVSTAFTGTPSTSDIFALINK